MMKVKFNRLVPHAKMPTKATRGSGAYDVYSTDELLLAPEGRYAFGTGLAMEVPEGFVALVCPRSGLAIKNGVTVLNAPGVVDSDYRGEVMVIMDNIGDEPVTISQYDRIAQMVVVHYPMSPELIPITNIDDHKTERGSGGFGSTGK